MMCSIQSYADWLKSPNDTGTLVNPCYLLSLFYLKTDHMIMSLVDDGITYPQQRQHLDSSCYKTLLWAKLIAITRSANMATTQDKAKKPANLRWDRLRLSFVNEWESWGGCARQVNVFHSLFELGSETLESELEFNFELEITTQSSLQNNIHFIINFVKLIMLTMMGVSNRGVGDGSGLMRRVDWTTRHATWLLRDLLVDQLRVVGLWNAVVAHGVVGRPWFGKWRESWGEEGTHIWHGGGLLLLAFWELESS